MRSSGAVALAFCAVCASGGAGAAIVRVPADRPTIQAGIDATTMPGDVVLVADGTYTGVGNRDIDFRKKAITVRGEHGSSSAVIDCQYMGRGFVFQSGEGRGSVLEGIGIRRGGTWDGGGGIYIRDSSPTVRDCDILQCIGYDGGGLLCRGASSPEISYCAFSGNQSRDNGLTGNGGAIDVDWCTGTPYIHDCDISSNTAGFSGGGIYCGVRTNVRVENCLIDNNRALFGGGVTCDEYCRSTLIGCQVTNNRAKGYDGFGGGIDCGRGSTPLIAYCLIRNNWASGSVDTLGSPGPQYLWESGSGGGLCLRWCGARVIGCAIAENQASVAGGGIYVLHGAGMAPQVRNCTLRGNLASKLGSGIYCWRYGYHVPDMTRVANTIVWDNQEQNYFGEAVCQIFLASEDWPIDVGTTAPTCRFENCDLRGGQAGIGVAGPMTRAELVRCIDLNPLFSDAYHIKPGSPCIDKGNTALVAQGELDIDLYSRPLGRAVEIGADEVYSYLIGPRPF